MWQAMQEAGLPETLEEAVERVQISRSSSEGFAFLGNLKLICLVFATNNNFKMQILYR
jgi:glutamate receptor, ionotropic, invertebrate